MIAADRFRAAVHRLADRQLLGVVWEYGPLTPEESREIYRRACIPYAVAVLAKRCWRRDMEIEGVSKPEWGFW